MAEEAMLHQDFEKIGKEILWHKYLYYIIANTELTDYEYDQLEKKYTDLAKELKIEPEVHMMADEMWEVRHELMNTCTVVGYPHTHPWAKEIEEKYAKSKS